MKVPVIELVPEFGYAETFSDGSVAICFKVPPDSVIVLHLNKEERKKVLWACATEEQTEKLMEEGLSLDQ